MSACVCALISLHELARTDNNHSAHNHQLEQTNRWLGKRKQNKTKTKNSIRFFNCWWGERTNEIRETKNNWRLGSTTTIKKHAQNKNNMRHTRTHKTRHCRLVASPYLECLYLMIFCEYIIRRKLFCIICIYIVESWRLKQNDISCWLNVEKRFVLFLFCPLSSSTMMRAIYKTKTEEKSQILYTSRKCQKSNCYF